MLIHFYLFAFSTVITVWSFRVITYRSPNFRFHSTLANRSNRHTTANDSNPSPVTIPEENPSFDSNAKSKAGVSYSAVLSGLYKLYPPGELEERNAMSRTDGYWNYINQGETPPQYYTYGEFDFYFFATLLDKAAYWYHRPPFDSTSTEEFHDEPNHEDGWEGKVFADIGSGTGRLVFAAAALHPNLKLCKGLEILPGIHNRAIENLESCRKISLPFQCNNDGIHHLQKGMILDENSRYTIVPVSSQEYDMNELLAQDVDDAGEKGSLETTIEVSTTDTASAWISPLMRNMQETLQDMTPDEWRAILQDSLLSNDTDLSWSDLDYDNTPQYDDTVEYETEYLISHDEAKYNTNHHTENDRVLTTKTLHETNNNTNECDVLDSPKYLESLEELLIDDTAMEKEAPIADSYFFESFEAFENMTKEDWSNFFGESALSYQPCNNSNHTAYEAMSSQEPIKGFLMCDDSSLISKSAALPQERILLPLAPISFSCGSFTDPYEYLGDVDVAFVFSSCMTCDMMKSLAIAIGRQCKPGSIVVTTEFPLPCCGYIDRLEDDRSMPFGEYELEIVDTVQGWCWLTGGSSTAYIHRVVKSLWSCEGKRRRPIIPYNEQAYRLVMSMEDESLTNTTRFKRNINNYLRFYGYFEEWEPSSVISDTSNMD